MHRQFLWSLCVLGLGLIPFSKADGQENFKTTPPVQWENLQMPADSWGAVVFEARNFGDQPVDGFLTSDFVDRPDQQFGRRFWVPPNSIRRSWFLLKTPPSAALSDTSSDFDPKDLRTRLIRRRGAIETSADSKTGERFEDTVIRCRRDCATTLLISDPDDQESDRLVAAVRSPQRRGNNYQVSTRSALPPERAALDRWTHIVLASDRILEDQGSVEVLRQWLVSGGKLWILLDQTGVETARPFLADAGGLAVVDRVGLTTVELTSSTLDFQVTGEVREMEDPVEMVRIIADGLDVLCQVGGWDAALTADVGHGHVLITTLGARGWMQTRVPEQAHAELLEDYYPTRECIALGDMFWGAEPPVPKVDVAEIATGFVGYRVTSLGWVASMLAAFCALVLLVSAVLWRTQRLAWLAWVAPAAAVAATLLIGIAGYAQRTAIPPTEASIQIAEADSLGNLRIEGGLSVYSASNGDTLPEVTHGGRLEFDNPPVGTAKRLIWSDFGSTHWENLELNTGVHELHFETFENRAPSTAILSLDEHGVTGRIAGGEWEFPDRGLIVSPGGQFAAPRFLEDGRFVSASTDRLPPGQFSASDVIDDRERTRMQVLESYFGGGRLPSEPRFYFWTTPLETGLKTQAEGRQVGEALVGLPIAFERPAAGTSVYCPPYLIGYRSVSHPRRGSSVAYSNRDRLWNDQLLRKSVTTLEFQLPANLGRLELERLKVFVDLNAPNRTFQLVALDRNNEKIRRELARRKSPVSLMEFEVSGDLLPPLDENLAFRLGLDVGPLFDDPAQEIDADRSRHGWQFRNVWVEAWGRTPE